METFSKVGHGSALDSGELLSKQLRSNLLRNLQNLFFAIVVASIEALFVLQKWKPLFPFLLLFCFIVFFLRHYLWDQTPVYLVDFSCFKPPTFCRVPFAAFLEHASMVKLFDSGSLAFMDKILRSSGLSEQTYLPPALHYIPPKTHSDESIKEAQMVLFPALDDLLQKTNLSPRDVDILIVNCSGFCPSPSLSSIVVNKYSMRSDIKSFNLSGMGCSASAVAVHLAQNLLKIHKNSNAIILSTEILSTGWYGGQERPKLILNCLFRMGAAAIFLTNRPEMKKFSKYRLFKTLRTQRAFDDKGYLSAMREEDKEGKLGVTLTRDLLSVAGETLRSNISVLGSSILPFSEKLRYGISIIQKQYFNKSTEIYIPNFKTVIRHFCLPTSGRPVMKEICKGLKLNENDIEATLVTLHRFGNQSSSSLWYELAYLEAKSKMAKGDKVWQLGMGTGPKCVSVIWECITPIKGESNLGPWADSLHQYPIMAFDQAGSSFQSQP